ncbi:hypothetical protein BOH66_02650 [Microbacterium aurum]|uniref:Uncharacterized protein n=1 Tax=Microbacterium aurum TaxID=36805 RepID=A0A1P8U5C2_9MICO|nr:hypothetical protein BOH66_02650 [Microbacterium aurum]
MSLALSATTDAHDAPIPGSVAHVDVELIDHVEGVVIYSRWRAMVEDCVPTCHATIHATITGTVQVIIVGQFEAVDEAVADIDGFAQRLMGVSLLDAGEPHFNDPVEP